MTAIAQSFSGDRADRAPLLNDERLWIASRAVITSMAVCTLALLWACRTGIDLAGNPVGTDYLSFYAASKLALAGLAGHAYSIPLHQAAETAIFRHQYDYSAFFYPPIYLIYCLPLALLPYFASLALFEGATLYFYATAVRRFGGPQLETALILAFPAVFVNAGHGQNGFLTAALFAFGLLTIETRPVLAGVLFACLAFKPQLGIVLPFVLIAARRWNTVGAAAATVLALSAAASLLFGAGIWHEWLQNAPNARGALEDNLVGFHKMQSLYAGVRVLGGSSALAYVAQGALTLAVIASLVWAGLRARSFELSEPILPLMATGALLTSPFMLDYDLTLLGVPLAWLLQRGRESGFLAGERLVGAVAFVLPLFARVLAGSAGLPPTPFVIGALFVLLLRRVLLDRGGVGVALA